MPHGRDVAEGLGFYGAVAAMLSVTIKPETVLDIGCAKGSLVECLRDIGIDARGVDVSEYAISHTRHDIRPFCQAVDIASFIPQCGKYDLITCMEMLEHLTPEQSVLAVEKICRWTDAALLLASSHDFDESSHSDVRPKDYWRDMFGRFGFVEDKTFIFGRLICRDAMLFRRKEGALAAGIKTCLRAASSRAALRLWAGLARRRLPRLPFRNFGEVLRVLVRFANRRRIKIVAAALKNGFVPLVEEVFHRLRMVQLYPDWVVGMMVAPAELERQRGDRFEKMPKISIATPVYNTDAGALTAMLESVLAQTYANWELCLADGASTFPHVREILEKYSKKDPRIKVKFLDENGGIAKNSNAALGMAGGEYIGLLDHDDLLSPDALYEIVRAIHTCPDADAIYSDEDKITGDGRFRFDPHFKPAWSPDALRSHNYITHFFVVRAALLAKIGGFREGYDGSQDYDLILRACHVARQVLHIPRILYHWRTVEGSTALNSSAKLYAYTAAKKALASHIESLGGRGSVTDGDFVGSYVVNYELVEKPETALAVLAPEDCGESYLHALLDGTGWGKFSAQVITQHARPDISIGGRTVSFRPSFVLPANARAAAFVDFGLIPRSPGWLEKLLIHAMRDGVGAAGGKTYYPGGSVHQAGYSVRGDCAPLRLQEHCGIFGYKGKLKIAHNVSAVAHCFAVRADVFRELGGFDPRYSSYLRAIDYCMKARSAGKLVVWTPFAEFTLPKSFPDNTPQAERAYFLEKWKKELAAGDPYYNANFNPDRADFSL
ncbi:MAG: glycosyltransferase [Elusimicrobiales bacterium]